MLKYNRMLNLFMVLYDFVILTLTQNCLSKWDIPCQGIANKDKSLDHQYIIYIIYDVGLYVVWLF